MRTSRTPSPHYDPSTVAILGFVVTIFGLAFLIGALRNVRRIRASKRWPTARGTVTAAGVESHPNRRGVELKFGGERRGVWRHWRPVIEYTYSVRGKTFESKAIHLVAQMEHSEAEAVAVAQHYHQGKTVTVYYDPRDPSTGILEPGVMGVAYGAVAGAIGFVAFGVLILYIAYS